MANDASTTTPKSLVLRARMFCRPTDSMVYFYFVLETRKTYRAVLSEPKPIIPSKIDGSSVHHQEPAPSVVAGSSCIDTSNQRTISTYNTQAGHKRPHAEMDSNADADNDQVGVNNNRESEKEKAGEGARRKKKKNKQKETVA